MLVVESRRVKFDKSQSDFREISIEYFLLLFCVCQYCTSIPPHTETSAHHLFFFSLFSLVESQDTRFIKQTPCGTLQSTFPWIGTSPQYQTTDRLGSYTSKRIYTVLRTYLAGNKLIVRSNSWHEVSKIVRDECRTRNCL